MVTLFHDAFNETERRNPKIQQLHQWNRRVILQQGAECQDTPGGMFPKSLGFSLTYLSSEEPVESKEKGEEKLGSNWPNLVFVTFKQTSQILGGWDIL